MKKMENLVLSGVIALLGVVGFASCSSSDDDNGNDPVVYSQDYGKGVVTQFALNIGSAHSATRSTGNVAQNNSFFRGMNNLYLIPMNFAVEDAAGNADKLFSQTATETTSAWTTTIYHLGDISSTATDMAGLGDNVYKKIYSLTLPVGTNNFLFYGTAMPQSLQTSSTTGVLGALSNDASALNGKLIMTSINENTTKASEITITLDAIDGNASSADGSPRAFLTSILNDLVQAKVTEGYKTTYWGQLSASDNANKTLRSAYEGLTQVKTGELRAGSAEAIRATLQELYRTVLAQERYGENNEVKSMAGAIRGKLDTYFDVYKDVEGATTPFVESKKVEATNINKFKGDTPGIYDFDLEYYKPYLKYKETDKAKTTFPVYQGLPSGVVNLTFTSNAEGYGTFSYNATSSVTTSGGVNVTNFTYPAELTYFASSALRASEISKEANDYPTAGSWDNSAQWDTETNTGTKDWGKAEVTADTRAVAMKNKIFYGVSVLKSTVKLGFNDGAALSDNRKEILNDGISQNQNITIKSGESFILTGILIGGQPDRVGWNFLSKDNAFNTVVYDRILAKGDNTYYEYPDYPNNVYNISSAGNFNFVKTDASPVNYTLLLDNYNSSKAVDKQDEVKVAFEFINNTGKDFYGRENIIPAGGTFYLVGKLTVPAETDPAYMLSDTNKAKIWNYGGTTTDYPSRIPGWEKPRMFIQDHTTEASFKIGTDALQKAYNSVPDLRSIQLTFGLSVDLVWRDGITFTDIELDQ